MNNKQIAKISIMVALMCIIAPLTIPIQPVPITMATFVLWTVAMSLNIKEALMATLLFVILGAFGLPVFSNYSGGLGKILGPTGGYIMAFPFTPLFFWGGTKIFNNKYLIRIFGVIASMTFISTLGIAWLLFNSNNLVFSRDIIKLIKVGYLVFIPSSIIKGLMASIVTDRIKPLI